MPTKFGRFVAHTYRSRVDGTEHIALVKARCDEDYSAASSSSSSAGSSTTTGSGGDSGGDGGSSSSSSSSSGGSGGSGGAFESARDGAFESDYPLQPFASNPERPVLVRTRPHCH